MPWPLEELRRSQNAWAALGVSKRLEAVRRFRGLVSDSADAVAQTISEEGGKTRLEALTQEVLPLLDTCLFLETQAEEILSDRTLDFKSRLFFASKKENRMLRAPLGVVGILGTWNYAFFLNLSQALFALVAGNAVALKFSELSPRVAEFSARLLREAGFPAGLTRVTAGAAAEGQELVEAGCDKYILTGSRAAGQAVMSRLGTQLKPAIVELSGSDPYLIFSDADWNLAVKSLIWATFQYSGQTCVAPRRVIVLGRDREKFMAAFKEAVTSSAEFVRTQGVLRTGRFAAEERRKIESLRAAGGRLLWKAERAGGKATSAPSEAVVEPQLWGDVPAELAGKLDWMSPVLLLLTVADESAALDVACQTPFGLAASVWTRSRARAERAVRSIRAGQVWVNDTLFSTALGEAPFGGTADSGIGRTRGPEGLLEMTEPRLVSSDFRRMRIKLHLPPHQANSYAILQAIQKMWFGTRPFGAFKAMADLIRACAPKK